MSIGNLKDNGNKGNNFPYQYKTLQLLSAINASINALPGVDYETRTTTYQAIATVGGQYVSGDIIVRYDIIDVATSTVSATLWFNQTTQITLLPVNPLNIVPINAPSGVTVLNGPLGAAVNIQDGGNSITVDTTQLPAVLGQVSMTNSVSVAIAGDQSTLAIYPLPANPVSGYTAAITGVAATDIIAAPGIGLFTYVTQILVTNSHATVGTLVTIQTEDGTGLYTGYAAPAGGGYTISFPTPLKMPVANKKLQAICGTTGSNVYVSASGFKL